MFKNSSSKSSNKLSPIGVAILSAIGFFMVLFWYAIFIQRVTTENGFETVLIDKPWFTIGNMGMRDYTLKAGTEFVWASVEKVPVKVTPIKFDEKFDDLSTSNNNFIDYDSYLVLQITDAHALIKRYPSYWYAIGVQKQFHNIVRNVIRTKTFDDIMTKPSVSDDIEREVRDTLDHYLKENSIPVIVVDMSLGKPKPQEEVLKEMNRTASEAQRYKTLVQTAAAEIQRAISEEKRADADNAYRKAIGLSVPEFVKLEEVKAYSESCRYKTANCVILAGGGSAPFVLPSR